jgi:hypothetical protein
MSGVKGKSGGKRPNSGRKRQDKNTSDKVKASWLAAARRIKRETGGTVEYHALKMALDPDIQDSVRASVFKIYSQSLIVKETKQDVSVSDRKFGPVIGLPPILREDPALEIQRKK